MKAPKFKAAALDMIYIYICSVRAVDSPVENSSLQKAPEDPNAVARIRSHFRPGVLISLFPSKT